MKGNYSSYWVKVLNGMGLGLFSSLIVGLILKQIGTFADLELLVKLGTAAQYMMGPAIAAGVARSIDAPPLAILSVLVVGAIGAGTFSGASPAAGEPMGAAVAAVIGAMAGKMIQSKSKGSMDILLIPLGTIIAGGLAGVFFAPYAAALMNWLGSVINTATTLHPFMMGIIISSVMGVILTLPISSAALAISLGLSGLAAGAATVGCSCQMIGFAAMSFRENGVGGLVSQGLGTSMIQMPNIVKNPWIWLPPTLTSAILGPVATMAFKMRNNSVGAGMGTSGLVGQVGTFAVMGQAAWPGVILLHFVLPAVISYIFAEAFRKKNLIGASDMTLKTE
ncbi:MAG: PTS sugar transporter subunit IIC [Synergistaceae bacterium]|nr:PTS sugar transporter subunit IIC [Synergistaceae bacterium]